MVKLTEDMIVARTRVNDLACVKKLNCWGADLDDVSVLQRLENVEMLSLRWKIFFAFINKLGTKGSFCYSLNSIETLSDFQHCKKLQELFLRKNHINSLRELLWLKNLAKLKNLWLAENPCSEGSGRWVEMDYKVCHLCHFVVDNFDNKVCLAVLSSTLVQRAKYSKLRVYLLFLQQVQTDRHTQSATTGETWQCRNHLSRAGKSNS